MNSTAIRRTVAHVASVVVFAVGVAAPAMAQTVLLTNSSATVIRGGAYANTNLSSDLVLSTRASSDSTYVRRVILKFDTQNTIPAGTPIVSAVLTVTVAGGNAESRSISTYRVASSYEETQATWNRRNSSTNWSAAGGDLAETYDVDTVTSVAGSRISFTVTGLVQGAVNGQFGSSRYTRIALVDRGGSSRESYKEYYSDEAADPSVRPVLSVTYGAAAPAPAPVPSTGGVKMRVLDWNLHHGVGTDGRYDLDRIATWAAQMKPDVITFNEVEKFTGWGNEDQPARYKAMMESKTGRRWYSLFAQEFGQWTSNGKGHLILSTYPIESSSFYEISYDRVIGEARITVNGRTVSLVVTHLDPDSATRRLTQALEVTRWAAAVPENRILTGDMNAWPDQTSIAEFNKTYSDSWTIAEGKGLAISFAGLTPSGATKKGRIDYIFFSKNAANLVVTESRVYDTRDANGVMPSDHRPVVTTFEVR